MRWCVVRWRGHLVYCLRDITPRENTIQSHGKGVGDKRTPPALLTAAHRSGVPTPVMPPITMGCSMPSISVTRVRSGPMVSHERRSGLVGVDRGIDQFAEWGAGCFLL